jgi:hypothetical protein
MERRFGIDVLATLGVNVEKTDEGRGARNGNSNLAAVIDEHGKVLLAAAVTLAKGARFLRANLE